MFVILRRFDSTRISSVEAVSLPEGSLPWARIIEKLKSNITKYFITGV
jgi:hypothetical protein